MSIPRECSTAELAIFLGVTVQSVARLSDKGVLVRTSRGRYDLAASFQSYLRYREKAAAERAGGGDEGYAAARTKRAWEQAKKSEHERLTREGQFLPRESVAIGWKAILSNA